MRKISKSAIVPPSLVAAPVPSSAAQVGANIYRADDVRTQLLTDQYNKCCYCECGLTKRFNDVEHYRYKDHYYWLGHDWSNLLYSCDLCNRVYKKANFPLAPGSVRATKPDDDLSQEHPLIINPTVTDPASHIRFRRYVAVHLTDEGKETIKLFDLNNKIGGREELIQWRKQLYEEYCQIQMQVQFAKTLLAVPDLSEEVRSLANDMLINAEKSLSFKTSPSTPFSGMLIAQI